MDNRGANLFSQQKTTFPAKSTSIIYPTLSEVKIGRMSGRYKPFIYPWLSLFRGLAALNEVDQVYKYWAELIE